MSKFYLLLLPGLNLMIAGLPLEAYTHHGSRVFHKLTDRDGLSSNTIMALAQDSAGFIWIGTPIGLDRYDGRQAKRFAQDDRQPGSLSSSYITRLLCTSDGSLWVGTAEGLNRYRASDHSFKRFYVAPPAAAYSKDNYISRLFEDSRRRLWIGTPAGLYCRTETNGGKMLRYKLSRTRSRENIRALCGDKQGRLWVGTVGGLALLQLEQGRVSCRWIGEKELSVPHVTALAMDGKGRIWIATHDGGLHCFSDGRISRVPTGQTLVSDLKVDRTGNLWLATPKGIVLLEHKALEEASSEAPRNLGGENILCLLEDRNASVWAGSYKDGISVTHLMDASFRMESCGVGKEGRVNAICKDEEGKLFAATEYGFCRLTEKKHDMQKLPGNLRGVTTLIKGSDGSLWAGTSGSGLYRFMKSGRVQRFVHDPTDSTSLNADYVLSLLEDKSGKIWVGTHLGLMWYDEGRGRFWACTPSRGYPQMLTTAVNSLYEDSGHNLWIGTQTGVCLLRGRATRAECFPTTSRKSVSYGKGAVITISGDDRGVVWIGTHLDGLFYYDEAKNRLVHYEGAEGLPESINNIKNDTEGNLWLSSYTTLYRLNPVTGVIRSYNRHDGLSGCEMMERSVERGSNGELFWGTNRGVLRFFPEQIKDNPTAPPVYFTSLRVLGAGTITGKATAPVALETSKELTLPYSARTFTIGFSVLNFIKSPKNQYAYRLAGLENEWHYSDAPLASYTDLSPGEYVLLAKGANNDGVWSMEPARLAIRVLPPWWRTWWAYAFYTIAFLGVTGLTIRFFLLNAIFRKEQALHQEKLNFFTNVSHEIRSQLMLVSGPVERLLSSGQVSGEVRRQLTRVSGNAGRLSDLVKELMDFRKAESVGLKLHVERKDVVLFLKNIFVSFSEIAESREIRTSFHTEVPSLELWFDVCQMEKVVYNLLSNAFKFTPRSGYVKMHIEAGEKQARILVTNSGSGISAENIKKLFTSYFQVGDTQHANIGHGLGLALSRQIAVLHSGKLEVESTRASDGVSGTTTFILSLLRGSAHFSEVELSQKTATAEGEDTVGKIAVYNVSEHREGEKPVVLLAENHEGFRNLICETLGERYGVVPCADGKDAYRLARSIVPDLIVADIMMEEMDGLGLCRKIKNNPSTSHIPVILLTAHESPVFYLRGLQHGADGYIRKPFPLEVLELQIRNLLTARKAVQEKYSSRIVLETGDTTFVDNREEQFLANLLQFIDENMLHPEFSVPAIARHLGMSEPVLYRKVRALLDMTVNDFIKTIRLKKAAKLLDAGMQPSEVAFAVGYSDYKYFSREFRKTYGLAPAKWKRGRAEASEPAPADDGG